MNGLALTLQLICYLLVQGSLIATENFTITLQIIDIPFNPPFRNFTIIDRADLPRRLYVVTSTDRWRIYLPEIEYDTLKEVINPKVYNSPFVRPSIQATRHGCYFVTNGGPFHADGTCIGVVVVEGHVVYDSFGGVGFGITKGPNRQWVIGKLSHQSQVDSLNLESFVTGFDWLVYNGTNVASSRNNTTGAVESARTSIGIDWNGRLLLVVSDGCERCPRRKGLTLNFLADELIAIGARHAINLDGGGSSVLIDRGRVVSHPTCLDIPLPCERAVTSVIGIQCNDPFPSTS